MNMLKEGPWVEAAGWTLLHTLWQTTVIALLSEVMTRAAGKRNAQLNGSIYGLAMALAVAWAAGTFGWLINHGIQTAGPRATVAPAARGEAVEVPATVAQGVASVAGVGSAKVMPLVVAAWAIGVMAMSVRLAGASLWIRRLRRTATWWDNSEWQQKFREWSEELGIRAAVRLCTTPLSDVPAVIGHFKPLVLLPAALVTQLTPTQLEAVILHELMHVRRHDFLWNLLQVGCETVFFFNPAMWWLSCAVRREREHACDELAATRSGNRVEYAKALVGLEELRLAPGQMLALGATGGLLKQRITRLLGVKEPRVNAFGWSGAMAVFMLAGMILALGWPRSIADGQKNSKGGFELRRVVDEGTAGAEKMAFSNSQVGQGALWVAKEVLMDQKYFATVDVQNDPLSKFPQILVRLTEEGTDLFARITRQQVGKQIAIVVNGALISAPRLNEEINGGQFIISGGFTMEEAGDLAAKLRPEAQKKNLEDTAEERALLEKEIALARKELATLERGREAGRVGWDEIVEGQRAVYRLEYEMAWLKHESTGMIDALKQEISLLEHKITVQRKKIETGAVTPDSLIPIERDLLRAQRELAATRKGRPPRPARAESARNF